VATTTDAAEPPRNARNERRRARTRLQILDAAEAVFTREGFHGARVEAVAEAADLSVGTLYLHFGGKHDILLALVDRSLELFEAYMERTADPAFSPLQRVLAGGDAYLRFHLDHPGLFDLLATGIRAVDGTDETLVRNVAERVDALLRAFAAQIDAAIAAGEARPVDAVELTRFLWGAWNGVIALRHQIPGLRPTTAEIEATLETGRWILREGLAGPGLRGADGGVGDRLPLPRIADPAR
jgi:AcrR family transcriptional regulator